MDRLWKGELNTYLLIGDALTYTLRECSIKKTFLSMAAVSARWIHNFRRPRIRFEHLEFAHEAFLKLAGRVIAWRQLQNLFVNAFK
ncbi:hypothetical protein FAZ69_01125 [Trinickia terrae]|uniref:Uncharacterized protein n=1 Tax=Trinickia terrae TaxID=2571161 RepID=A0A4U1IF78_9BURK|nr:hypothetical protein [Trinickia terrae]TKC92317.1 hypothetical protein FAZ69_01125 [Trinickia terrae]